MTATRGSVGEASFALMLHGSDLPMEEISARLALTPTRTIHRGEVLNELPRIEATADEWMYAVALSTPEGEDEALKSLLTHLKAHRTELRALKERCQVTLRLNVQSDYARMAYSLMPETLTQLVEIGLPLSVSSLSWGEIGL